MKIAYLMDPLESIQPENETTSHLMYECNKRGHTVYFLEPHDVYIRGGQVVARMHNVTVKPGLGMIKYWHAIIRCTKQEHLIFDAVTELASGTTNYRFDFGYFWINTSAYFGTDSSE